MSSLQAIKTMRTIRLRVLLLQLWLVRVTSFTSPRNPTRIRILAQNRAEDLFDETRRQELFEVFLRDLQIQNVPILELSCPSPATVQASFWSTLEQTAGDTTCLIYPDQSTDELREFLDTNKPLKEMDSIKVSLVGNGLGPALVVNATQYIFHEQNFAPDMSKLETVAAEFPPSSCTVLTNESPDPVSSLALYWNAVCQLELTDTQVVILGLGNAAALEGMEHATILDDHSVVVKKTYVS